MGRPLHRRLPATSAGCILDRRNRPLRSPSTHACLALRQERVRARMPSSGRLRSGSSCLLRAAAACWRHPRAPPRRRRAGLLRCCASRGPCAGAPSCSRGPPRPRTPLPADHVASWRWAVGGRGAWRWRWRWRWRWCCQRLLGPRAKPTPTCPPAAPLPVALLCALTPGLRCGCWQPPKMNELSLLLLLLPPSKGPEKKQQGGGPDARVSRPRGRAPERI